MPTENGGDWRVEDTGSGREGCDKVNAWQRLAGHTRGAQRDAQGEKRWPDGGKALA